MQKISEKIIDTLIDLSKNDTYLNQDIELGVAKISYEFTTIRNDDSEFVDLNFSITI